MDIKTKAEQARLASIKLASTSTEERNRALIAIAGALKEEAASIDAANKADLDAAESSGLATP
jgi:glutamate-5-semialdehyde dehydrogenase